MFRFILHLFVGLALLALAFFVLSNIPFRLLLLAYVAHIVTGGLNILWFAAIIGLMIVGGRTRRPGLIAAPFVFFTLWASASVIQRSQIAAAADPALADRSIPADLRALRTLIFDQQGEGCCGQFKLLADGHIDRYVFSDRNDDTGVRGKITAYRLARASECNADEIRRSTLLAKAGRTDECFAWEELSALPDGIVLRMKWMRPFTKMGCCNEGLIFQRTNGSETVRATWHSGQRVVLSYLPLLGFAGMSEPTGPSDAGPAAPMQLVWIGGPRFQSKDMAAAIYGIAWDAPISPARVTPAERLARAQSVASQPKFGDRLPAIDIAMALAADGQITDDLIRLMVSFIEYSTAREPMTKFWFQLTEPQRQVFTDTMMARIREPSEDKDYIRLGFAFIPQLPAGSPLRQVAGDIFGDAQDLKVWQYEAALRLAQDRKAGFNTPAYAEQQRRFLRMVRDDTGPSFASRALAFLAAHPLRTDEERQVFGERLDRVPDAQVEEMIRQNWHRTIHTTTTTEATHAFRHLALARIARMTDERLRRQAQEWFKNRTD